MNLIHVLDAQAKERGQQTAIIEKNRSITYQDLAERSELGALYLDSLGLKKGDVILIFVPMTIDLYVILMAIWRRGLLAMFVDPSSGRDYMGRCCERVKAKAFIGIPKAMLLRWFTPALRQIGLPICTGFFPFMKKWPMQGPKIDKTSFIDCDADTPALITFTSGSTGLPKAAVRTHGFLLAQHSILHKTLELKSGDYDLATLPIFALANLASGLTTVIPNVDLRFPGNIETEPVFKQIKNYKPRSSVASPAFFECLVASEEADALNNLDVIFTGGAPVFPRLLKALQEKMPKGKIVSVYGSTEAEPIAEIAYKDVSQNDLQNMAAGKGLLAGEVVGDIQCLVIQNTWGVPIQTQNDQAFRQLICKQDEVGEIVVFGDHVLKGYLDGIGDEENKFKVNEKVWHRTGDLGYFDQEGKLWLLGRCSAIINDEYGVAYPFAVETAVMQNPLVERAAMCEMKGIRILVIETLSDIQDLKTQLSSILESFKIEKVVEMEVPMDKRHNAKVDYPLLKKSLQSVL